MSYLNCTTAQERRTHLVRLILVAAMRAPLGLPSVACALIVASALSVATLHAQQPRESGTINGKVLNQATGRYLAGAVVSVVGTQLETVSSADGSFRLPNVPAGEVTVTATYTDLDRATRTITVRPGQDSALEFGLSAKTYEEIVVMSAYVISGEREGSARATQEQRTSVSQKAIYTSDSFGNVVDSNVGELMKNLPGVTIDYDGGGEDASRMMIRGMNPDFALVTLDGNEMASIRGTDSRSFNLATQSLANIDSIELKIAPLPSDGANAMSGVVNLVSKSALQHKGRRVSLAGNLSLNTRELTFDKTPGGGRTPNSKIMPGFAVSYSEALGEKRPLGIAFNASFNRSFRYNNSYTLPGGYLYDTQTLQANGNVATQDTPGNVAELRFAETGKSEQQRMVSLNLDWQASRSTVLYLYSTWNDVVGLGTYSRSMNIIAGSPQTSEANLTTMVAPADSAINMNYSVGAADSTNVSFNAGARHTFGELKINYGANFSRADTKPDPEKNFGVSYGYNRIGVRVDDLAGNGTGRLTQIFRPVIGDTVAVGADDPRSYQNLKNYSTNDATALRLNRDIDSGRDERRGAFLDVTLPTVDVFGVPLVFQTGAKRGEQERFTDRHTVTRRLTGGASTYSNSVPQISQFADPYFRNTWDFDMPIADWVNPYAVLDYYNKKPGAFYYNEYSLVDQQSLDIHRQLMGRKYTKEAITAGYAMVTARPLSSLTLIAGVRYEYTKVTGEGPVFERYENSTNPFREGAKFDSVSNYLRIHDQTGVNDNGQPVYGPWYDDPRMIINPYGPMGPNYLATDKDKLLKLYSRVGGSKSYDNWFPNVQAKWTPRKDMNVRLARTQAVGRANFSNILPNDNWIRSAQLIRRSNPGVKPETSVKYDLAIEYYFKNNGMLTLALFRQDWEDLVRTQSTYVTNVWDPELAGVTIDGENYVSNTEYEEGQWTVERPTNAGKGVNEGGEISYRQRLGFFGYWLRDFEVFASFSYANPKTWELVRTGTQPAAGDSPELWQAFLNSPTVERELSMPGIQKRSGSLQLAYLGNRFSARIRGYWVGEFVRSFGRYYDPNYQDSYIRCDLSLNYKLSARWTAGLDWRNITNDADSRHIFDRTGGYFTGGMVINLSVKANF